MLWQQRSRFTPRIRPNSDFWRPHRAVVAVAVVAVPVFEFGGRTCPDQRPFRRAQHRRSTRTIRATTYAIWQKMATLRQCLQRGAVAVVVVRVVVVVGKRRRLVAVYSRKVGK